MVGHPLSMEGKKGLIMGVVNKRSIAWAIAEKLRSAGAQLALTYQGEALEKRVTPLAQELDSPLILPCDVEDDKQLDTLFAQIKKQWGTIDFVLHSLAWSDKDQLRGPYIDTTQDNFTRSLLISCYSFTALARRCVPLMPEGGSMLTLSYYGAEKVIPHYNVMGVAKAALEMSVRYLAVDLGRKNIRVNALSAGPLKTLAASGIGGLNLILKWNQHNAPLKRNVSLDDVAGGGYYLLSDLSKGVTGEVHHIDCGYHVVGMKAIDAPDIALV